jgi:transposase-like protein
MRERIVFRYSEAFKREVVEALESGRFGTQQEARNFHGIRGADTIPRWIRRHGKDYLNAKVVRVEKPNEADRVKELQKQVAQLQRALGQTQAQNLLNEEFLKRACQRLGEDLEAFKKKNAGMPSIESSGKDGAANA